MIARDHRRNGSVEWPEVVGDVQDDRIGLAGVGDEEAGTVEEVRLGSFIANPDGSTVLDRHDAG
jgi:hypothetical protein